ncbi:hypothetical protein [Serratia microhaemolytica]|uniref:hypothetical protein n=1 Tax=Serratia microhaemolytica TaxID=2675110 RepID=UPI000FDD5AC8|nr:hypothetical protein [Serratia microhaemolytica]
MRAGFRISLYNSGGVRVHRFDSIGKPELELAELYRIKADTIENAGFHRIATTLRDLVNDYQQQSESMQTIMAQHYS